MKLNHFICPVCGHDFYAEGKSVACDACQCCFYASQSKTCARTIKSDVINGYWKGDLNFRST